MAQDIVADALNQIQNAGKARKRQIILRRYSKFLLYVLEILRAKKYLESYRVDTEKKQVEITLGEIFMCKAIKPRFTIHAKDIQRYLRRYLPAKDYGYLIISTNQGLMTHYEAIEKNIGGSLVAVCY
jgi:small subunit ribosomal protein S8